MEVQQLFPIRQTWLAALLWACAVASQAQQATPEAPSAPAAQASANVPAEFAAARKFEQEGKLPEAIAELQTLEARDPATKGLALELGTAFYKKNDLAKAIEYLKKATAEDPANGEATQLLGLSYYLAGHPAEAIPLLEKMQSWYSRANVDAAYILGISYIQTKDYDHARKSFGKMFDVPPDSAASYLFTARMLFRQEYDPVAEEYAQKAATLDPKLPLVHFLLGELYLYKSRVPEAIAEFQKELAINPGHAETYYKLADAYSRCKSSKTRNACCSAPSGWTRLRQGPISSWEKCWRKKGNTNWRCALCNGPPAWTRIIQRPTTCSARPTAIWGRKKKRRANSSWRKSCEPGRTRIRSPPEKLFSVRFWFS